MKIKFERIYGENRIGDVVEFEKGEELNYNNKHSINYRR